MALKSWHGFLVAVALAAACGPGEATGPQAHVVASSGDLSAGSGIACATEVDCAVCYRGTGCGVPIHAGEAADAPECHGSPTAFCMPRRAHCDDHHCVAR